MAVIAPPHALALAMALAASAHVHAQDRYGSAQAYDSNPPPAAPMAVLTWPGKTAEAPAQPRYAAYDRQAPEPAPTSIYDAPPLWQAARDAAPPPPAPAPDAAPPPAPAAQHVADGQPPHFYSLARQYGVQPDPVALSPQFLAASPQADMAEPPPLPPSHTLSASSANMSSAAATSQLRQAQEAASDAEAASLGN